MTTVTQLLNIISKEVESTSTLTVLGHPHSKKKFPNIQREVLGTGHPWKESGSVCLIPSFQVLIYIGKDLLWSLPQIEQPGGITLSPFLIEEMTQTFHHPCELLLNTLQYVHLYLRWGAPHWTDSSSGVSPLLTCKVDWGVRNALRWFIFKTGHRAEYDQWNLRIYMKNMELEFCLTVGK